MMTPAQAIERLFSVGPHLPGVVRAAILAGGDAMVSSLLTIATDDALLPEDARGRGFAPLHAIDLLGELRATAAIPSIVEILRTSDPLDLIRGVACLALERMGAPACEPCLAALATCDEATRLDLCYVLAKIGVRDERIFRSLVRYFAEDTSMGVRLLAQYGDARALPLLTALRAA